jgi:hypothetical protein
MPRRPLDTRKRRDHAVESRITSQALAVVRAAEAVMASSSRLSPGVYRADPIAMLRLRESLDELKRRGSIADSVSLGSLND